MSADSVFPNVDKVEVDLTKLAAFSHEDEFTEIAFNLFRETMQFVIIAACIMGEKPKWDRDSAVVGGNMVRLFKLGSAFLDQVMQQRMETAVIFARLIYEACVNVRFLVVNYSPELIDSYVQHSLKHERKLRDKINSNIKRRGGKVLPIEDRMLRSIARTEHLAGISLDNVDLKDKAPWGGKHLQAKAESAGLDHAYLAAFGGGSHHVHGSWQDISQYQLQVEDVAMPPPEFKPQFEWSRPRPQYLLSLSIIVLGAVGDAVGFLGGDAASAELDPKLVELESRVLTVSRAHEAYLSKKTWPEI